MQCFQCSTQFADGMPSCPTCGMPANNQFMGSDTTQGQPYGYNQNLSKKEFLHHPNIDKCRKNLNSSAATLYVCAVLSLVVGFIFGSPSVVIDVALIVGLGLGVQLAQSRVCAILICIYGAFNTITMTITNGRPGGYLILIAAVYAVIATFQFQKAWDNYKKTGILPASK